MYSLYEQARNLRSIYALLILVAFGANSAFLQELHMPRNVKAAYAAGLRSKDGKPNAKYFQNKSTHNIKISVAPSSRIITGSQDIIYKNNTPFPLDTLVLRFDMNAHAPEAMREAPAELGQITGDLVVDEYAENGNLLPWKPMIGVKGFTFNATKLSKPLLPGGTVTLSFKWHYELAATSNRDGAIDPTTFYLAYFYPRVAVLDNLNGFDQTFHLLGGHEFYNEFNDYNVEVTVPKNFIVWGTGELTNIDQVLQPRFAERLKRSFKSDEVINIASLAEVKAGAVTAQSPTVTWKWKSENVPDVVYALSDHYIWDASSLVVDKKTGRRASTQAAYDEPSKGFTKMVTYIKSALDYSSNELPGVPYPYPKMTIVRGLADMEAPMMANDNNNDDPQMQHFVAAHEILHTYYPFYMGIHERKYGFMEEGWTTAFEYGFNISRFGKEWADEKFKAMRVKGWITNTEDSADLPIMIPENVYFGYNKVYGDNKYGRSALGYLALQDLLGNSEFKRALHGFMNDWNGKHPVPWDMFYSFNTYTGKDLNWFWNAWFFSQGYIDLAVGGVTRRGSEAEVTINNIGGYPAPVDIIVKYEDGSLHSIHQTPAIWQSDLKQAKVTFAPKMGIESVVLDGGIFMDANPKDNKWGE